MQTSPASDHGNLGDLKVDRVQGSAPLTVTLLGPSDLVEALKRWQEGGQRHSKWGDGFSINWGDGSAAGDARIVVDRTSGNRPGSEATGSGSGSSGSGSSGSGASGSRPGSRPGSGSGSGSGARSDSSSGSGSGARSDSSSSSGAPKLVPLICKHVYSRPGQYSVSASLYDFMPDDSHKQYWKGSLTVTVK